MAFILMKWMKNIQNIWIGYKIVCDYNRQYVFVYTSTRKGESVEFISKDGEDVYNTDNNHAVVTIKAFCDTEALEMIRSIEVNKYIDFNCENTLKVSERLSEILC